MSEAPVPDRRTLKETVETMTDITTRRSEAVCELDDQARAIANASGFLDQVAAGHGIRIVAARTLHAAAGGTLKRQSFATLTRTGRAGLAHLRRSGNWTVYSRLGAAAELGDGTPRPGEMTDTVWARLRAADPVVLADRTTAAGADLLSGGLELPSVEFPVAYSDLGVELVTRAGNYLDAKAVMMWMFEQDRRRRATQDG